MGSGEVADLVSWTVKILSESGGLGVTAVMVSLIGE